MQFNLLAPEKEIEVPITALKGENPKAKLFFWTGEYFGVSGHSMGEPCVFWLSKSKRTGRWVRNPNLSPVSKKVYSFKDNRFVPSAPIFN